MKVMERYKRKWSKEKNHLGHRFIWEQEFGQIPDCLIVHHLDKNRKNNDINNLCLMTITAHNRVHAHTAWNKGITALTNKKWAKTIDKAQKNRFKTFLPKFKEAAELQSKGKKLREIAVMQGISRRQVSGRINRYKEYVNNK